MVKLTTLLVVMILAAMTISPFAKGQSEFYSDDDDDDSYTDSDTDSDSDSDSGSDTDDPGEVIDEDTANDDTDGVLTSAGIDEGFRRFNLEEGPDDEDLDTGY